jgi:hypothetical protein
MKRYHSEKHIIERRVKQHRQINAGWLEFGSWVENAEQTARESGRYRKTLRSCGCTRARCQVCHPEKYPKRIPTRQERQLWPENE